MALLVAAALFAGCSGGDFAVAPGVDDAAGDSSTVDSGVDATADTEQDAVADSVQDSGVVADSSVPDVILPDSISTDAVSDVLPTDASDGGQADAVTDSSGPEGGTIDAGPCSAPIKCFPDKDSDHYPGNGETTEGCGTTCPTGYITTEPTTSNTDCNDSNPAVHPGANAFQTAPYCVDAACSATSFDYNCDGVAELADARIFGGCGATCGGAGWLSMDPPGCGVTASFRTCSGLAICSTSDTSKTQGCR